MARDVYYFTHDYHPTQDPKIQAMLGKYGAIGYGLYWRFIEMLHADEKHKIQRKPYLMMAISKQMNVEIEIVMSFIEDCINYFELFKSDADFFFCERVNRNILKRDEIIDKRKAAGMASANARKELLLDTSSTHVEHTTTSDEQNATNKTKLKESKGNKKEKKEGKELSFDLFWNLYDKKVDCKKSKAKFLTLSFEEIEQILATVEDYVKAHPDEQFRKNPTTYLNGECWKDAIPKKPPTPITPTAPLPYNHPDNKDYFRGFQTNH